METNQSNRLPSAHTRKNLKSYPKEQISQWKSVYCTCKWEFTTIRSIHQNLVQVTTSCPCSHGQLFSSWSHGHTPFAPISPNQYHYWQDTSWQQSRLPFCHGNAPWAHPNTSGEAPENWGMRPEPLIKIKDLPKTLTNIQTWRHFSSGTWWHFCTGSSKHFSVGCFQHLVSGTWGKKL